MAQIEAYRSVADKKKTRGRPETKKSNGKNESRDVNVWHLVRLHAMLPPWVDLLHSISLLPHLSNAQASVQPVVCVSPSRRL